MGRVLDRLYACGTMRLWTAWAVRAATRLALARRAVHLAPPSCRGGEEPCAEPQALPCPGTSGSSQETRPDRTPCGRSTRCVDRAGPRWGKPEEGHASAKSRQATLGTAIAQRGAPAGVAPGASIDRAAAALVPEAKRAAPRCRTRCPATDRAGGRARAAAVART